MRLADIWVTEVAASARPLTCVVVGGMGLDTSDIDRVRVASAADLVDELVQLLARNGKSQHTGLAGAMSAFLHRDFRVPPVTAGVLVDDDLWVITALWANAATGVVAFRVGDDDQPEQHAWAHQLVERIVFAFVPDTPRVERDPDIYADTVRLELDGFGAPLDVAWHNIWEASGVRHLLHVPGVDVAQIERVPYRTALPANELLDVAARLAERPYPEVTLFLDLGPRGGHAIHLRGVEGDDLRYADSWHEGTLVDGGVPDGDDYRVGRALLVDTVRAAFVVPEKLADLQGVASRRGLADVFGDLAFFGVHEVSRSPVPGAPGQHEVVVEPGGFRESVQLRFVVTDGDLVEASLLRLERAWLLGAGAPFGLDILRSVLVAVVSPLDVPEVAPLHEALRRVRTDPDEAMRVVGSGPPHLRAQQAQLLVALVDPDTDALGSYQFTRLAVVNADGWLHLGAERAGRTVGRMLVGDRLPRPWDGVGASRYGTTEVTFRDDELGRLLGEAEDPGRGDRS